MKRKQIVKIERTLMRFQDGDLYTPVELDGVGVYHAIAKRLETLRLTMLNLADSEVEFSRRTNKSIAAVAHDMKTPLSIISGYAECISDGMDDKDYPALICKNATDERHGHRARGVVSSATRKGRRTQIFARFARAFRQNYGKGLSACREQKHKTESRQNSERAYTRRRTANGTSYAKSRVQRGEVFARRLYGESAFSQVG